MTISVVIPTYNGEQFLEEAILSVLNQKREADEIIISDDNSTDNTLSICEKYKNKLKIYVNNSGPSGFVNSWNYAINKASGDFVSILHQDDLLHSDFLYEAEELLKLYPDSKHLFASCDYIDENGVKIVGFPKQKDKFRLFDGLGYVKAYQSEYECMPHIHRCPGVLTHRSVFDECTYNPDAGHIADDDFFFRVGKYTSVIGILYPLASYRIHKESETGSIGDYMLVKRLSNDYVFQVKQWKDDSFLDEEAFSYFIKNALKFIRRRLGYALRRFDVFDVFDVIKQYYLINKILR